MPKSLTVVGFGPDPSRASPLRRFQRSVGTMSMDSYLNPYDELGSNWRWATSHVPKGSIFFSTDASNATIIGGDSGGPAIEGDVAWAAVSGRINYGQLGLWYDFAFAGVDGYGDPGRLKNNRDWLINKADLICTKRLITLPGTGVESIYGTTIRPRVHPEIQVNGIINMNDTSASDSVEYLHEGMSIQLTATMKPGYSFSHWVGPVLIDEDGNQRKECPCHGSSNPVCVVSFDNIGYYTDTVSNDYAHCSVAATGAPTGGTTGGTPGGTTGGINPGMMP